MEKKAETIYTIEILREDIFQEPETSSQNKTGTGNTKREYEHKLKVMQMLIELPLCIDFADSKDEDKTRTAIELRVNNDALLSGFVFFLSNNVQFDYTWNYLRKKVDRYITFLLEAKKFMMAMIADINTIVCKLKGEEDIKILFNDIFEINITKDTPYVKAAVLWENFDRLMTVKDGYYVTIKRGDTVLATSFRNYSTKVDKIAEKTLKLLERNKRIG